MRMNSSRGILVKMLALVMLAAGCTVTLDEYGNITSITPTVVTDSDIVVVPGVIGQTLENAEEIIADSGLNVANVQHQVSSKTAGTVISQVPLGGHTTKSGGNITLTIAVTGEMVNVPIVTGRSQFSAALLLKRFGLRVGNISKVPNATAKRITVMRQNPRGGSRVVSGSKVDLVLRVPQTAVTVPNVIGKTYLIARNTLQKSGYKVIRKYSTSSEARNKVIAQSPTAGSALADGATVTLTLSRGGTTTKVPSVVGKNVVLAKSAITRAGFKVKIVEVAGVGANKVVISQSPTANFPLKRGGTVTLKVRTSRGKHSQESVVVPNIVGKNALTVRPQLSLAGLQLGRTTYKTGRAGYILAQTPRAGMKILRGSKVNVVVGKAGASGGNNTGQISVPSVVGKTYGDANSTLRRSGLKLLGISYKDGLPGRVLSQNPRAGTKLAKGQSVSVVIGKPSSNNNSNRVRVPSLTGLTSASARATLARSGLVLGNVTTAVGNASKVIRQTPSAGASVPKGTRINIVIGKAATPAPNNNNNNNNAASISVPNVVGQSYGLAATTLRRAGLKLLGISYEVGTVGKVIRQNPAAGTKVANGAKVSVVIGKAAPAENKVQVTVPNVVGTPVGAAIAKLRQLGLVQGRISYAKGPNNRKGKVFVQTPRAGTKVTQGTKVDMTIGR